jgi:hypothetical protein
MAGRLGLLVLVLGAWPRPAAGQESFALIVTGLSGEPSSAENFDQWALRLKGALEKRHGLPKDRITYLAERPEKDPAQIDGRSTRDGIVAALARTAERARPGDLVFVLLIGHGSYLSGESRFNLPGPDLTAEDWKGLLARFSTQQVVFVNAASASGEFVKALAGPNRVIVTATKSGLERNQTTFPGHFVEALTGDSADADKNGRVSILEAFDFARREVARGYEKGNRLLTEHALLDDDGDGTGSPEPGVKGDDGALARRLFLAGGGAPAEVAVADDPRLAELLRARRELEEKIEALKARKASLAAEAYEKELEALLLDLALKGEAIRNAGRPPR